MMTGSTVARRLEGKVAIITGGASGIGAAAVKLFLRSGANVIMADIQDELGHSLCKQLAPNDDRLLYVHCDITREEDLKAAVDYAVLKHGKLDIMYNNAGIPGAMVPSIVDVDKKDLKRVFEVNVMGAFYGAKQAARVMIPARKGCILFTASMASVTSPGAFHPYVASKHAVNGLAKNLCVELGKYGIRVNCVSPHGVATPMGVKMTALSEEDFEKMTCASANLKGVTLRGEDIAEAAVFLASDGAKCISGVNILVDGGFSLSMRPTNVPNPEDE